MLARASLIVWAIVDILGLFFLVGILGYFAAQVLVIDLPKWGIAKVARVIHEGH